MYKASKTYSLPLLCPLSPLSPPPSHQPWPYADLAAITIAIAVIRYTFVASTEVITAARIAPRPEAAQ